MPTLTVDDRTGDVPEGQRLVLAIEALGVNIGHRCGGYARCTACRVEFLSGEPDTMTASEYKRLRARGFLGQSRLSCQIIVDRDMQVHPLMTLESEGWSDTGPQPEPVVTPDTRRYSRDELENSHGPAEQPV